MNLADHMLASVGGPTDPVGMIRSIAATITRAQRFDLHDDVALACYDLVRQKPSSLNAALPLCRLPFETMWVEYRGGALAHIPSNRSRDIAPVPARQGFLIESPRWLFDEPNKKASAGQVGWASLAWYHAQLSDGTADAVNASPFAIYFDWRPDGDVAQEIRAAHRWMLRAAATSKLFKPDVLACAHAICAMMEDKFLGHSDREAIAHFMLNKPGWEKFAKDPKEIEAMLETERHMLPGVAPHALYFLAEALRATSMRQRPDGFRRMMDSYLADITGEGPFVEAVLAMLNSRNCVTKEHKDLTKLNKARARRGKGPLLDFTTTKLVLSRAQRNVADAQGITHEAARRHLVRGHFKVRRTGVYWWSPFVRGKAAHGDVARKAYEVST